MIAHSIKKILLLCRSCDLSGRHPIKQDPDEINFCLEIRHRAIFYPTLAG
uniref:Uncharacterized protein n=1 Tax=Erwinia piriflorinigrans CFBP 5888 TaxID=1161919 RepID=V5Z2L6_9GAMM|nr:hypothetical protein EPIR_pEPIR37029 [Erwinia piriflorinigrans CFBP 5888]